MLENAGVVVLVVGIVGAVLAVLLGRREASAVRDRAAAELDTARERSEAILEEARAARAQATAEREQITADLRAREDRLDVREHRVADRAQGLDAQEREVDAERMAVREVERSAQTLEQELRTRTAEHDTQVAQAAANAAEERHRGDEAARRIREELDDVLAGAKAERRAELERVAALTSQQARAELVAEQVESARRRGLVTVREIEDEARRNGETLARRIVADAVQRVAADQTAESVVSVVQLPGDDMKGRIIGREGRNIRTFEAVTGVNLVIDDTPGAVLLSCFDPVRRERARVALQALITDGRIHPQRIEAAYEDASAEVDRLIDRAGAEATEQVGIHNLHPDLVRLLGQLRYRTSYGQNVLGHLIETAHVASSMAAEIGVKVALVKRCAFLHDIGKALTHEVEGTHAMIGADLARRYGEHEEVVHAIAAHHNEIAPETVEAVLTQAADACSGGRPGARREALESYVERLNRLEAIASAREGVEKVFAMSAGRELRVMVQPSTVDDAASDLMARDIAAQIADELTYPGQIKVTVVRESRATATAT